MIHLNVAPKSRETATDFSRWVRAVPDFPKKGILFRDITPLLAEPEVFRTLVAELSHLVKEAAVDKVVGLESRGFIFGIAVAQALGLPFVPARKAGKLPGETVSVGYALEYGEQRLELQKGAIRSGERVAIIDDLLATGGTAAAAAALVEKIGGSVAGFFFAIELDFLKGRQLLGSKSVSSILHYKE